jgi:hypothetical protein
MVNFENGVMVYCDGTNIDEFSPFREEKVWAVNI